MRAQPPQGTPSPQPPPQWVPVGACEAGSAGIPFTDDLTQAPQALPGPHIHCLCSTAADTTSAYRGRCWEERLVLEGRCPYLAGELPLQRLQLLLGPEGGAPFLAHAGAQLVHLPQELPLRLLQLLDSVAGSRRRLVRTERSKHGRRFSHTPDPLFIVIWPISYSDTIAFCKTFTGIFLGLIYHTSKTPCIGNLNSNLISKPVTPSLGNSS